MSIHTRSYTSEIHRGVFVLWALLVSTASSATPSPTAYPTPTLPTMSPTFWNVGLSGQTTGSTFKDRAELFEDSGSYYTAVSSDGSFTGSSRIGEVDLVIMVFPSNLQSPQYLRLGAAGVTMSDATIVRSGGATYAAALATGSTSFTINGKTCSTAACMTVYKVNDDLTIAWVTLAEKAVFTRDVKRDDIGNLFVLGHTESAVASINDVILYSFDSNTGVLNWDYQDSYHSTGAGCGSHESSGLAPDGVGGAVFTYHIARFASFPTCALFPLFGVQTLGVARISFSRIVLWRSTLGGGTATSNVKTRAATEGRNIYWVVNGNRKYVLVNGDTTGDITNPGAGELPRRAFVIRLDGPSGSTIFTSQTSADTSVINLGSFFPDTSRLVTFSTIPTSNPMGSGQVYEGIRFYSQVVAMTAFDANTGTKLISEVIDSDNKWEPLQVTFTKSGDEQTLAFTVKLTGNSLRLNGASGSLTSSLASGELGIFSRKFRDTTAPTQNPVTVSPLTAGPTRAPITVSPTRAPTTVCPTNAPLTISPTNIPTVSPETASPITVSPTKSPVTANPVTQVPTSNPITEAPVFSVAPSLTPVTMAPVTLAPSKSPTTQTPTAFPTTGQETVVSFDALFSSVNFDELTTNNQNEFIYAFCKALTTGTLLPQPFCEIVSLSPGSVLLQGNLRTPSPGAAITISQVMTSTPEVFINPTNGFNVTKYGVPRITTLLPPGVEIPVTESNTAQNGPNGGIIAALVICGMIGIGVIGVIVWYFCVYKNKKDASKAELNTMGSVVTLGSIKTTDNPLGFEEYKFETRPAKAVEGPRQRPSSPSFRLNMPPLNVDVESNNKPQEKNENDGGIAVIREIQADDGDATPSKIKSL